MTRKTLGSVAGLVACLCMVAATAVVHGQTGGPELSASQPQKVQPQGPQVDKGAPPVRQGAPAAPGTADLRGTGLHPAIPTKGELPPKPVIVYPPQEGGNPEAGGEDCASATPIGALPFSDTGSTIGMLNDYDAVCPYTGSLSPDAVYSYSPGAAGSINIDLCGSLYDTKVYVYQNACGGGEIACNDDICGVAANCGGGLYCSQLTGVPVSPGNTYYIVVDGYGGASGTYNINVTENPPPGAGDDCSTAYPIASLPFSDSGSTIGQTNNYDAVCPFTGSTSPDVVYSYAPASSGTIDISLCGSLYDTKVYVYQDACIGGAHIACNDDGCGVAANCGGGAYCSSLAGVPVSNTSTYFIVVDGWSGASGTYNITVNEGAGPCVTCTDTEGEPDCGLPVDTVNGGCNSTPNVFSTINCGDTVCGSGAFNGATRDTDWYQLVLTQETGITFTVTAQFASLMGVVDTGGIPDCAFATTVNPAGFGNPCEPVTVQACLPAGTWWLFVAPVFGATVACPAQYTATLECSTTCPCVDGGCCKADMNDDDMRNGADIAGFTAALLSPPACGSLDFCRADVNDDGFLDNNDIAPFAALIILGEDCPDFPDTCDDALEITGLVLDGPPVDTAYDNTLATSDGVDGQPHTTCNPFGDSPGILKDLWFYVTVPANGLLKAETCPGTLDTKLAIYDVGCTPADFTDIGCSDDDCGVRSSAAVGATAGSTYYVRVGSWGTDAGAQGPSGASTLRLTLTSPQANDECAGALAVACNSSTTFDQTLYTSNITDPAFSCYFGGPSPGTNTAWFVFTAADVSARLQTCNSPTATDTLIAVYDPTTGCTVPIELCCSEDACGLLSRVCCSNLTIGSDYIVQVASFAAGSAGLCTLDIECPCPPGPAFDQCAQRGPIFDGLTAFSTLDADTDGPIEAGCQFDGQTYHDIWYNYEATCTASLRVTTCSGFGGSADYDTDLVVYDGCDCNALVRIGCNDDGPAGCPGFTSLVEVPVVAGNCYKIRVGGWLNGDMGTGTLNIECFVPPPPCDADCSGTIDEGEPCGSDANGGCNSTPPIYTAAACGTSWCGTAWAVGGTRDTDWYAVNMPAAGTLNATLSSEFPGVVFIVGGAFPPCAPTVLALNNSVNCSSVTASAAVAAGDYVVFVATGTTGGAGIFDGFPCGGGNNDYRLDITCN